MGWLSCFGYNDWRSPLGQHDSHFVVENSGLSRGRRGDQVLVYDRQNVIANLGEFLLHLLAVTLDQFDIVLIPLRLFLLLNGRHDSPRGPSSTYDIFVSHRKKIPLLHGQLKVQFCNFLHTLNHFCIIN